MRRRRRRRDAEAQSQPTAPSTPGQPGEPGEPGDESLEAALRDVAHRFIDLTDQAENELDGAAATAEADQGWLGLIGALQDSPDEPLPHPAAGSATANTTPGGAEPVTSAGEPEPGSPSEPAPDATDAPVDAGEDGPARAADAKPARRRPRLRGRRRAWQGGSPGAAGTGPAGAGRWRKVRRTVPAALVAAALAVPGSGVLDGVGGLMRGEARNVDAELALGDGGFLPIEDEPASVEQFEDPEQLEAVPVGEDPVSEPVREVLSSAMVVEELGASDIPEVALSAYNRAADRLGDDDPACRVRWSLLAAIGRVESNHGRFGGAQLRADGYGTKPIRGIPLDGRPNVARILDTDGGELDGDTTFDRAVGPMQFIPSTWRSVGVDANDDGRRDPNNMFDATQGAAGYLCAGGGDLGTLDGQARAVRRYNNADEYVRVVLSLARMYDTGRVTPLPALPALPGPPPLPQPQPEPQPEPRPTPEPQRPAPTTTTPPSPRPGGPPATTAPLPTTPPTTAAPAPTTTTTTTTVPPTTSTTVDPAAPTTTTTVPPPTTTVDPAAPAPPAPEAPDAPAAVGWAPAMREVVVGIIEGDEPAPPADPADPADPGATGQPACEPPAADPGADTADDDLDGNVPEPPAECTGEAPPPTDPATVSTP